jgi:hypothetical protein
MRRILSVFCCAVAFTGCASTKAGAGAGVPVNGTPLLVERAGPDLANEPGFDARAEAHRFDHAADCEIEARALEAQNADRGWKLLRACVERGDFTDLRVLLDGAWDRELRSRPDAGEMLTRLIAVRGGDIEGDVAFLHDHRVPVFTLADALAEPDVYAGRLLVMRVRVSDFRKTGDAATVQLDEYTHNDSMVYAPVGRGREHVRKIDDTGHDGPDGEAHHVTVHDRHNRVEQRMASEDVATGRQALGKLEKPDPFLEPDKDFVVLARFDGVRQRSDADDDHDPRLAVVTLLHYFRPGALSLY